MISIYTKNIEGVWFGVALKEEKIFGTSFAHSKERALQGLLSAIPSNVPSKQQKEASTFARHVLDLIKNIYEGKDVSYSFSFATEHLSNYAKKILETVYLIPVGYVSSYGSVAKAGGGSPRAVGRVMAMNPFAPVVPCHRVVSSDFTLGGYGGGLKAKLDFLKREKRGHATKGEIPVNGKKLQVFPVEFVLEKVGNK